MVVFLIKELADTDTKTKSNKRSGSVSVVI
jgi:hypothetical protein